MTASPTLPHVGTMSDAALAQHVMLGLGELIARNGLEICIGGTTLHLSRDALMTLQRTGSAVRVSVWPPDSPPSP